jgi:hypothetical protein
MSICRTECSRRLKRRGRQVVLHGPTGVGKTSLVNYLCSERNFPIVRVECGPPFEDMMREALGLVVGHEEIEKVEKESDEAEIGVTLWGLLTGKARITAGSEAKFAKYPVSFGTTLAESFRIMKHRVLFLDNFENLRAKNHYSQTASEIVQLMKSLADRSAQGGAEVVKVVSRASRLPRRSSWPWMRPPSGVSSRSRSPRCLRRSWTRS